MNAIILATTRRNQEIGVTFPEILEEMQRLRDKGYSYGRIAEAIYDKYGISYNHSSVNRILKRLKKDKKA